MGQSYLEQPPPSTLKHGHTLVVHFSPENILLTYYASKAVAQQPKMRLPLSEVQLESRVTRLQRGGESEELG